MADITIDVAAQAAGAVSVLDKVKAKVAGLGSAGSKVKLFDAGRASRDALATGRAAGDGFVRGADGRLRDARGRFAKAGGDAGTGFVSGLKSKASGARDVFKGILGAGAVGLAVGAASAGLRVFDDLLGDSVAQARESQKVGAATAQVIKSTGKAAGISAAGVGKLSTALSNQTGVDDEVVQGGANMLLTFTNIRNGVGKGNDVFNQATKAALDLGTAMGTSPKQAALQLGKALNDPVKGLSKLQRSGVTFTDQQKKQVAALQKSGDVLGAQKIILGEVNKEFGGQAAATSTAGEKMATYVSNLKEQLGTILLPYIDRFATFFTTTLGPAISAGLSKVGPAIGQLVSFVQAGVQRLGPVLAQVRTFMGPVVAAVQQLIAGFQGGGGLAALQGFAQGVQAVFGAVLPIIRTVLVTVLGVIQQSAPQLRQIATTVGQALQSLGQIISAVWGRLGPLILPSVQFVFKTVILVVSTAVRIVAGVLKVVSSVLKGDWRGAWKAAGSIVSAVVDLIKGLLRNMLGVASTILPRMLSLMSSVWSGIKSATSAAWSAIKAKVTQGVSSVVAKVKTLPARAKAGLGNLAGRLKSAGADLIRGFINGVTGSIGSVVDAARRVASSAVSAAKAALGIRSPSRVFAQLGRYVGQGLEQGLTGSAPGVKKSAAKLAKLLSGTFKAQGASKSETKAFLASVKVDTDQLLKIAKKRAAVAGQIQAAEKKLTKLRKDYAKASADYRAQVTSSAVSFASITGIEAPENATLTASTLVQGLRDRYAAILNFTTKVKALSARGLNKTTLDQIVQAGVDGGAADLNALSSASPALLAQINSLQAAIGRQSTALGDAAGQSMYGAGVRAQEGLIAGLKANDRALAQAADSLADKLVGKVKAKLGIKSPSRVFRDLGQQTVAGLNLGLDPRTVRASADELAGALTDGFGKPKLDATVAGLGAATAVKGGNTYNVTVMVERGSTDAEVGRSIVGLIKAYERETGRR